MPARRDSSNTRLRLRNGTADAQCIPGELDWLYNSVRASPCDLAAVVWGSCSNDDLPNLGDPYYPGLDASSANPCSCSWAAYNLLSGCAACQNQNLSSSWTEYSDACVGNLTDEYFPPNVELKNGTLIPSWAGVNASLWTAQQFDVVQAATLANLDKREYDQRQMPAPPPSTSTFPGMTSNSAPTSVPEPDVKPATTGLSTGATIGITVGICVALLAVAGVLVLVYIRRITRRVKALEAEQQQQNAREDGDGMQLGALPPYASGQGQQSQPLLADGTAARGPVMNPDYKEPRYLDD